MNPILSAMPVHGAIVFSLSAEHVAGGIRTRRMMRA